MALASALLTTGRKLAVGRFATNPTPNERPAIHPLGSDTFSVAKFEMSVKNTRNASKLQLFLGFSGAPLAFLGFR